MKKIFFKIVLTGVALLSLHESSAQELDSLKAINSQYESFLHNDHKAMDILFYKHQKDVLINNLGPYGSAYYTSNIIGLSLSSIMNC